ncbi:MAG: hypothetical protein K6B45_01370 [Bacteroidaceae bacterium]|nr:hypothetical protein [Bacteroidaceae bacterium]
MNGVFFDGHGGNVFLGKKDIWMAGEGKFWNVLQENPKQLLNVPERGGEVGGGRQGRRRITSCPLYIIVSRKNRKITILPRFFEPIAKKAFTAPSRRRGGGTAVSGITVSRYHADTSLFAATVSIGGLYYIFISKKKEKYKENKESKKRS